MPEKLKMRDVPPTGVRLAPELKNRLAKEAAINGRTLHAEILIRIQQSLDGVQHLPAAYPPAPAQPQHTTGTGHPPLHAVQEKSPADSLTEIDRALLGVFRRMPVEKQLALLSLFK